MIHHLPLLFISEHTACFPRTQATFHSPPASLPSAVRDNSGLLRVGLDRLKFVVGIAGNALGLAGLIAGCWMGLQVLQAFL